MFARHKPGPLKLWRGHPTPTAISLRSSFEVGALASQGLMFRRICKSMALLILMCVGVFSVNLAVVGQSLPMIADLTEANDGSTIDIAVGASVNVSLKVPEPQIY